MVSICVESRARRFDALKKLSDDLGQVVDEELSPYSTRYLWRFCALQRICR